MFVTHRIFLIGLSSFVIFGALCLTYGYFIEPNRLVVSERKLAVRDWNPAFNGLKIVMIGDVHGGSNFVTEDKLRQVVTKINGQNADLVVMLGDFVSQGREDKPIEQRALKMPVETIANGLSGINAKYGVFAVLGNHDGYHGDDRVASELTRIGYRVLQNEVATIEKDGQSLRILGFRDHLKLKTWQETSADAKQSLSSSGGAGDIIALEHSPDVIRAITGEHLISPDLKLMLAAHTHGGQVWLPIFGRAIVPSAFGQKYAYGHVRENNVDLFVTSGVGMSVLPFRFMVPPEIAVLTIYLE
jgi:predicted MPP superfamily phosphohydrolase